MRKKLLYIMILSFIFTVGFFLIPSSTQAASSCGGATISVSPSQATLGKEDLVIRVTPNGSTVGYGDSGIGGIDVNTCKDSSGAVCNFATLNCAYYATCKTNQAGTYTWTRSWPGCSASTSYTITGITLSGHVRDDTGRGISGVIINQDQQCLIGTATTDNAGYFHFDNITYGQEFCMRGPAVAHYTRVSGGYECQKAGDQFDTKGCGTSTTNLDIAPDTTYDFVYSANVTLSGKVVDQSGKGIGGIEINPDSVAGNVRDANGNNCQIGKTTTATTGDIGSFQFTDIRKGRDFCMRVAPLAEYTGPVVQTPAGPAGAFDCQSAGVKHGPPDLCGAGEGNQDRDLAVDNAYNFVFTKIPVSCLTTGDINGNGVIDPPRMAGGDFLTWKNAFITYPNNPLPNCAGDLPTLEVFNAWRRMYVQ